MCFAATPVQRGLTETPKRRDFDCRTYERHGGRICHQ
jgi:hypothetical protein